MHIKRFKKKFIMLVGMRMIHSLIYISSEFKSTTGSPKSLKSSNVFLTLTNFPVNYANLCSFNGVIMQQM